MESYHVGVGAEACAASLFARAADEGWLIGLSHEPLKPVGRLLRDRDRFRYEPV